MTNSELKKQLDDAYERGRSDGRQEANALVGYLCMECGDNGEVVIRNSIIQEYDRFTIVRDDTMRGGVLIKAVPD